MEYNRPCDVCFIEQSTERHHMFSNTRLNRKLYRKLLDDDRNIIYLCYGCHHNKSLEKMNERQFCDVMGIEPRSKSGAAKEGSPLHGLPNRNG